MRKQKRTKSCLGVRHRQQRARTQEQRHRLADASLIQEQVFRARAETRRQQRFLNSYNKFIFADCADRLIKQIQGLPALLPSGPTGTKTTKARRKKK